MTRSFDVLFNLHPNKLLSKQSSRLWFEKQCAHYDITVMWYVMLVHVLCENGWIDLHQIFKIGRHDTKNNWRTRYIEGVPPLLCSKHQARQWLASRSISYLLSKFGGMIYSLCFYDTGLRYMKQNTRFVHIFNKIMGATTPIQSSWNTPLALTQSQYQWQGNEHWMIWMNMQQIIWIGDITITKPRTKHGSIGHILLISYMSGIIQRTTMAV